jgi:hypothetical protein
MVLPSERAVEYANRAMDVWEGEARMRAEILSGRTLAAVANPFLGKIILKEGRLSIDSLAQLGFPAYEPLRFRGGLLRVTGTGIASMDSRYVEWENFNGGIDVAEEYHAVSVTTPVNVAQGGMFCKSGAGELELLGGLDLNGQTLAFDVRPEGQGLLKVTGTLDLTGCTIALTGEEIGAVILAQATDFEGENAFTGQPGYRFKIKDGVLSARKEGGTVIIVR